MKILTQAPEFCDASQPLLAKVKAEVQINGVTVETMYASHISTIKAAITLSCSFKQEISKGAILSVKITPLGPVGYRLKSEGCRITVERLKVF